MTTDPPVSTARLVMEEDATAMNELWATNLIADAELRNNLRAVLDRGGNYCYVAEQEMDTLATGPEPDTETLAAVDAGINAAIDELQIVRAIAVDNEVRDRCYEG